MNQSQRKFFVNQQIFKLNSLLEEWEQYQVLASNPSEKQRSKNEIERLKLMLEDYESELKGGAKVDEEIRGPLLAPEIRKNNRKWILGIFITLLIIAIGVFSYLKITEVTPDYSKYLSYLNQGDSFVKANNYTQAKVYYKKALEYNPGDSIVIKKISYLKKADELITQNKFTEAKDLFKIIIEIEPSTSLSKEAISIKSSKERGTKAGEELQFSFKWEKGVLLIRISGGSPFQGSDNSPYEIDGLNCDDCIEWTHEKEDFIGRIPYEKVTSLSIRIKDSNGKSTAAKIPTYKPSSSAKENNSSSSSVVKPDNTSEENFTALIESGDKYFSDDKFSKALDAYQQALAIKPKTKDLPQKIEICKKKVTEEKIAQAKNIARINVPAGSFTMGYEDGFPVERPEHLVKLNGFSISKTEVTVSQYRDYCSFTDKPMPPSPPGGWIENNPITNVTWEEARSYCNWVGGRLPTEAEWEYAAKEAGVGKKYSGSNNVTNIAVYKDNSGNRPATVGQKQPNALRLYDMTGNVLEWCSDWFGAKYYAASEPENPKGAANGTMKIVRGGAYNSSTVSTKDGNQLRVTYRNQKAPSSRENYIGFRVAW